MGDEMPVAGTETKTSKLRRWSRMAGCWLLKALLVIVIIAVVCYVVEVINCLQLNPTGDELFDKYARAVRNRSAWKLYTPAAGFPTALPASTLAQWEDDYWDDPHYWQLRYFCAVTSGQRLKLSHWQPSEQSGLDGLEILRMARSKQVLDVDTAILLMQHLYEESKYGADRSAEEKADLRSELKEVVSEIKEQFPDAQWGYFAKARISIGEKEYELALSLINQGLAATDKHLPQCYPMEVVVNHAVKREMAGNPEITGALLESGLFDAQPFGFYPYMEEIEEFIQWVVQNGTRQDWDSVHKFACCIGSAQGQYILKLPEALKLERMLVYQIIHYHGDELQDSEREMLLMLSCRNDTLQEDLMGYYTAIAGLETGFKPCHETNRVREYVYFAPEPADRLFTGCRGNIFYSYHPARWRLDALSKTNPLIHHHQHTWKEFHEMYEVDMTVLEIPEDWLDLKADTRCGLPVIHPDREKEYNR